MQGLARRLWHGYRLKPRGAYAEGRGISKNPIQEFVWLSLAAQQAVKDVHNATSVSLIKRRDKFAQELNSEALDQPLKLVGQCSASQYKISK
jgi:hypothetical protein